MTSPQRERNVFLSDPKSDLAVRTHLGVGTSIRDARCRNDILVYKMMEFAMHWVIGFLIGIVILFAAIAYAAIANTRRNRANDAVRNKATQELYKDADV